MPIIALNLESDAVPLPAPLLPQKVTLDEALMRRRSARSFVPDSISMEVLSALLWAAFGVNREQQGGRTAPSARDWKSLVRSRRPCRNSSFTIATRGASEVPRPLRCVAADIGFLATRR